MPLFESTITANFEVASDYYQMDFTWPAPAPAPAPGQFFTIRIADAAVPLLRRPFGVSGYDASGRVARTDGSSPAHGAPPEPVASMIYWRRGPGTKLLAGAEPGDPLSVMGPLGVGFPSPSAGRIPVLVAGGVGIGPILFFANELARTGLSPILVVGARTAAALPRVTVDDRVTVHESTDDGSAGFRGTAIELLEQRVDLDPDTTELFLCGPDPMLRAGHEAAAAHGVTAWVSMEQTMGCAVGACMGCAVRVHAPERYARVCTEGPVFRSTEIVWE